MPLDGGAGIAIERRADGVGQRDEIDRFGMEHAVAISEVMHGTCLEHELERLAMLGSIRPSPRGASGASLKGWRPEHLGGILRSPRCARAPQDDDRGRYRSSGSRMKDRF